MGWRILCWQRETPRLHFVLEELSFRRFPRRLDLLQLVLIGILENFGYRQVNTWWRVVAFGDYFRVNLTWGKMGRKGFGTD